MPRELAAFLPSDHLGRLAKATGPLVDFLVKPRQFQSGVYGDTSTRTLAQVEVNRGAGSLFSCRRVTKLNEKKSFYIPEERVKKNRKVFSTASCILF